MKSALAFATIILATLYLSSCGSGPNRATRNLHTLFDEHWEWTLKENPEYATHLGDDRYNDRLSDMSLEAVERRQQYTLSLHEQLLEIDRSKLSSDDQLNYALFRLQLGNALEGIPYNEEYQPVNQMGGIQIQLPILPMFTRFRGVRDYEDYLTRLGGIPLLIEQTTTLMRKGMGEGRTPTRVCLRSVPDQIKAQVETPVEDSPFYRPFSRFPGTVAEADRQRLAEAGRGIISGQVIPAFKAFLDFFTNEYLPGTREEVGVWALPDGLDYYAYRVRTITTTNLIPEEIHQIGLGEVKRIRVERERVIVGSGFEGTFDEFTEFLRTDPQFYYTDAEELLRGYRDICKRVDYQLPRFFGRLPRTPYGVEPIPDFEAPASTTAYYREPAADGSRPGTFYANTYRLDQRPRYEMEALAIHEAVPGHHLQIALAQELEGLPNFRKHAGFTAFVEGWGLYSESLGEEMGFYQDSYSKSGQLTYEMWRAVRLVVDTGLHYLRWTRQQAIDFFLANTGLSEHNIIAEVDRYIVWPGQALAYKIGELKIKELRARAEEALSADFNIRAFHDMVLGRGAVPLDILEQGVLDWIEAQQAR